MNINEKEYNQQTFQSFPKKCVKDLIVGENIIY